LRKLAPIALISLLTLAGCAPAAEPADPTSYAAMSTDLTAECDSYQSGDAVKQVKVTGEFGSQPEVSFPTPLSGTGNETAVIIEGNGGAIVGNQRVALHFTGFNAATGEQFQGSEFGTDGYIIQDLIKGDNPDFCTALTGVQVGSRVAILFDAANAHQNNGVASLGIGENDGILFIFDVVDAYLPKAVGSAVAPVAGMPTVILAPNGQPGIQIPATDAPSDFQRELLIEGQGETVNIGDTVVVHYSGWTWQGNQFDSSWDTLAPASFQVSSDSLIEGFVQALDGVKIGSQVVAVIPPALGYGDNAQGSIPAGSTLIFVIDVLGKE
jgi:FKBP-type peptidyl-prolyl cis-trans isomerase